MPAARAGRFPQPYRRRSLKRRRRPLLNSRRRPTSLTPIKQPAQLRLETVVLDEQALARSPMLPYVRMIVNLIDGLKLTCREVLAILGQSLRQRSIAMRRRIDYLLGFLHRHPP